jgi:hypothetical protein
MIRTFGPRASLSHLAFTVEKTRVILAPKGEKNFFLARFGTIQHDLARWPFPASFLEDWFARHFGAGLMKKPSPASPLEEAREAREGRATDARDRRARLPAFSPLRLLKSATCQRLGA